VGSAGRCGERSARACSHWASIAGCCGNRTGAVGPLIGKLNRKLYDVFTERLICNGNVDCQYCLWQVFVIDMKLGVLIADICEAMLPATALAKHPAFKF
jgi:hypothetical protein